VQRSAMVSLRCVSKVRVRRRQCSVHCHAHLTLGIHILAEIQKGGCVVGASIGRGPKRQWLIARNYRCCCMLVQGWYNDKERTKSGVIVWLHTWIKLRLNTRFKMCRHMAEHSER
jgi:hypothetical protein